MLFEWFPFYFYERYNEWHFPSILKPLVNALRHAPQTSRGYHATYFQRSNPGFSLGITGVQSPQFLPQALFGETAGRFSDWFVYFLLYPVSFSVVLGDLQWFVRYIKTCGMSLVLFLPSRDGQSPVLQVWELHVSKWTTVKRVKYFLWLDELDTASRCMLWWYESFGWFKSDEILLAFLDGFLSFS